jgi:penicillin-binding protein 2
MAGNPDKPMFNRAVTAGYPPGSVLKPLVALAALENGVVTSGTRYEQCVGKYRYGNRDFSCWSRHGSLNLLGAITHSCNVYFYQLGLALGLDSLVSYCGRFPLGRETGIDLPAETKGNLPDRVWLDNRYGEGEWKAGVLLNLAIGQGEILATPLQMAVVYSALANRGYYLTPHVLARVDSAGKTTFRARPKRFGAPLSQRHLATVSLALERVVDYGTARTARLKEITIAGKTGTAQNPGGLDHAWFVGYAPADEPEIVVAVLVENSGHGGVVAAPIARQLFRTWFMLPDDRGQPG